MRVCFRTKGNNKQGMGDVMGSLSIADEFVLRGHEAHFIVDDDPEAVKTIEDRGHSCSKTIDGDVFAWGKMTFDIAVINQLNSSAEALSAARKHSRLLVTIDDTGDPSRECADLRINPLYYDEAALCEPKYIPLTQIFREGHETEKTIHGRISRILITIGGADTYGYTPSIIDFFDKYADDAEISVILGPAFKHEKELSAALARSRRKFNIMRAVPQTTMFEKFMWADVVICGGGNTLFEAACCGVPAIVVASEPFEEETAFRFEKLGFGKAIPFNRVFNTARLDTFLRQFKDREVRILQSKQGKALVDGNGAPRITDEIIDKLRIKYEIDV